MKLGKRRELLNPLIYYICSAYFSSPSPLKKGGEGGGVKIEGIGKVYPNSKSS